MNNQIFIEDRSQNLTLKVEQPITQVIEVVEKGPAGPQGPPGPNPASKTSELINDGADGVNPFITAQDIPTSIDTLDSIALRGNHSSVPLSVQDLNYKIGYDPLLETTLLGGSVNTSHTGTQNTIIGSNLPNLTTGNLNVAVGKGALRRVTTGFANTFIGVDDNTKTEFITGKHNVAIGYYALSGLTTGRWNFALGTGSSSRLTTGSGNISIGYASNNSGTTGNGNICIGTYAGPNRSSESTLSNKLIIENRLPNVTSENSFWDETPLPSGFSVTSSFIYGDFLARTLNLDATLSVTPTRMPVADTTYTKNIVAKPNGTFGWEDNDRVKLPNYTKVQRDALPNKKVGDMIWQTDTGNSGIRVFDGTNWLAVLTSVD